MGNETAVKLLTDSKYTGTDVNGHTFLSYTDLSNSEDATSLKNFARALNYIDECNKIRTDRVGVQALKVDLILMALAEINANYSYVDTNNHAARLGEHPYYDYYNENMKEITQRNISASENLAGYGYYDINSNTYEPFQYWYDDEEQAGGGGHYSNIRNKTQHTTGFGCNTTGKAKGMYVAVQNFSGLVYGATASEKVLYTTDELRTKLKEFIALASQTSADTIAKAQQAVTDAQAAVDSAKSALATATSNVTTKQAAVTAAQNAYDTAKQSYQSDATTKVANAQKNLDTANAAKAQADTDVTAAQTALSTARSTLATKNADLAQAKQAKQSADDTVTARQADVNAAKDKLASIKGGMDVTDAQKAVDTAEQALADAKQKASEAADALAIAKDAAAEAQSAYDAALTNLADANAVAEKAKKSAADASARLQDAYGAYASLKQLADARDNAQKALDAANATYETAKQNLVKAQQTSKDAQANADALAEKAAESAAAYDALRGLTVDGILDGSVTAPKDVVDEVLALAKQRADAEARVADTRKALDAAEEAYGTASAAYGKALDAYQAALEEANAAADAYKTLATEIANRQQGAHGGNDNHGIHGGHHDGGNGTNGGTGNGGGVSTARGHGHGHTDFSNGRHRQVGHVSNGRAAASSHRAKPRYVVLGEQPDASITVASDSTNGQAAPSASTDAASDAKQDVVTVTNDTKDTDSKTNGSRSGKTTGKQKDATPTKSDADKDGDTGINPAVPIIGVAIVGGSVVATVYASKRKKNGDSEDSAGAASKQ